MVELAINRLGRFSAFNLPEVTFLHEAQPITSAYVANVINICCLDSFCKMNYSNVFAMAQQARSLLGAAVAALEGACTFFDL